jgi:aryl-alcohol dehydrogenase-like predicted oxidoreductase
MSSRIVLGTAQFGMPYGIANDGHPMDLAMASETLSLARRLGIDRLDTAAAYGESERRLGTIGVSGWRIVSKVPAHSSEPGDVRTWVDACVERSLQRLGVPTLYGLLLHRPMQLLEAGGDALYGALSQARARGQVEKIGVSVYSPEELDALLPRYEFDLVQAPMNVVDRRLLASGWLRRLRDAGVEVHVRSVFLQGLLLMGGDRRPPQFERWAPLWRRWHEWLEDSGATPVEACVAFALGDSRVDGIVVGVDSSRHLLEIAATLNRTMPMPPAELACDDVDLINPSRWRAN